MNDFANMTFNCDTCNDGRIAMYRIQEGVIPTKNNRIPCVACGKHFEEYEEKTEAETFQCDICCDGVKVHFRGVAGLEASETTIPCPGCNHYSGWYLEQRMPKPEEPEEPVSTTIHMLKKALELGKEENRRNQEIVNTLKNYIDHFKKESRKLVNFTEEPFASHIAYFDKYLYEEKIKLLKRVFIGKKFSN